MGGRRSKEPPSTAQVSFAWADAARVLEAAPDGEVVYEAPELRRRGRKAAAAREKKTIGLPFGVRETDGRSVCWSCGSDVDEDRVVRVGPGDSRCPGCGAKLPFV